MLKYHHPELDASKDLEDLNTYQQLFGILRWSCELGRIYILTEVSVLSQHLQGHLDVVFHIFNFLNVKN